MKTVRLLMLGLLALLWVGLIGCGWSKTTAVQVEEPPTPQRVFEPEVWQKLPQDDANAIYGKGTAVSANLQTAIDKADLIAASDIAANMERWVQESGFLRDSDLQKWVDINTSLNEGANVEESYKNVRKQIVSNVIRGTEEFFNESFREDGRYRVFRALKLPVGRANKALKDQLAKNEEIWQMYKDTKELERLEADIKEFEAKKKAETVGP